MQWILILWIMGDPNTTAVMTQPDEATCEKVALVWTQVSDRHEHLCIYGNLKEMNLEEYQHPD